MTIKVAIVGAGGIPLTVFSTSQIDEELLLLKASFFEALQNFCKYEVKSNLNFIKLKEQSYYFQQINDEFFIVVNYPNIFTEHFGRLLSTAIISKIKMKGVKLNDKNVRLIHMIVRDTLKSLGLNELQELIDEMKKGNIVKIAGFISEGANPKNNEVGAFVAIPKLTFSFLQVLAYSDIMTSKLVGNHFVLIFDAYGRGYGVFSRFLDSAKITLIAEYRLPNVQAEYSPILTASCQIQSLGDLDAEDKELQELLFNFVNFGYQIFGMYPWFGAFGDSRYPGVFLFIRPDTIQICNVGQKIRKISTLLAIVNVFATTQFV